MRNWIVGGRCDHLHRRRDTAPRQRATLPGIARINRLASRCRGGRTAPPGWRSHLVGANRSAGRPHMAAWTMATLTVREVQRHEVHLERTHLPVRLAATHNQTGWHQPAFGSASPGPPGRPGLWRPRSHLPARPGHSATAATGTGCEVVPTSAPGDRPGARHPAGGMWSASG